MAVVIKVVKAKFNVPNFAELQEKETAAEARNVKREYEITTRTFSRTKVEFYTRRITSGVYAVGTNNKIYKFLDQGTRPHIIRAKRAKVLRFNSSFRSKTVPGRLNPRSGKSAGPVAWAKQVKHPGTKARGFSRMISERSRPRFKRNFDKALANAVARTNRG